MVQRVFSTLPLMGKVLTSSNANTSTANASQLTARKIAISSVVTRYLGHYIAQAIGTS